MVKRRFSSHRRVMKSLLVGIGCYLCKVYNYHDSRACGYKRSEILPRIEGIGLDVEWSNFWFSCVKLCDL
jgi:hypothetical protein